MLTVTVAAKGRLSAKLARRNVLLLDESVSRTMVNRTLDANDTDRSPRLTLHRIPRQ